jgi:hypothetical protein
LAMAHSSTCTAIDIVSSLIVIHHHQAGKV